MIVEVLLKYGKANPNLLYQNELTILDEACDNYFIKTAKGYIWCTNKKDCKKYLEDFEKTNKYSKKYRYQTKFCNFLKK